MPNSHPNISILIIKYVETEQKFRKIQTLLTRVKVKTLQTAAHKQNFTAIHILQCSFVASTDPVQISLRPSIIYSNSVLDLSLFSAKPNALSTGRVFCQLVFFSERA